jgi:peroxiredoxin
MAPDFSLPATGGDKVRLAAYRGKQPVVVFFYIAAFGGT